LCVVLLVLVKNKSGYEEYSVVIGSIIKFVFNNAVFDFVDLFV
jgi:hypothetical protein